MKAVQINTYGGSDVVEINQDAPKPTPQKGQILVEVHASSINPIDWKIREGYMKDYFPLKFPIPMGRDFSGVVIEIGEGVTEFKTGDEVFGQASVLNGGSGAFAQFASANTTNIAYKPKRVDHIQSAALPLVGASAVQALEEHIKLQSGRKIVIHGGAGGIGSFAIQLAKATGAYVATTVSTKDMDFVKELGAGEVIDYKNENFEEKIKDFDAVFDTVGGDTIEKSFQVLKKDGVLVTMAGMPDQKLAEKHSVTAIGQGTKTNTEHLNRVRELVDSGKVKVQIDKVFPLDQIKEAFDYQKRQHPRGKVVIKVKD